MDPNDKNRPTVYRSAIDFINRADFRPFAILFLKKTNGQYFQFRTTKEIVSAIQSEMWSEFFSSMPEDLQFTTSLVKSTILSSKADGNLLTYIRGLEKWKRWASSIYVFYSPSNPFQVSV